MNPSPHPDSPSNVPWPTSDDRVRTPDTSMLPGSEKPPSPAVGMLKNAVQGAHDTIDRIADSAAPAARQLGDGVAAAQAALHARTAQLCDTRDAWAEGARTSVRSRPLVWVAAALALGFVFARLTL